MRGIVICLIEIRAIDTHVTTFRSTRSVGPHSPGGSIPDVAVAGRFCFACRRAGG
jgi:hypothetical protein